MEWLASFPASYKMAKFSMYPRMHKYLETRENQQHLEELLPDSFTENERLTYNKISQVVKWFLRCSPMNRQVFGQTEAGLTRGRLLKEIEDICGFC
ncbi:hypothetical protein J437_LFUL014073 [Ladona fulva]|uniref:Uncharacterized protein n=1 Tax=Ladona fulva TaxID=123851 RepID=A0A8K0KKN5_LADFU|nr:hypothetical protein J437_LFUL014073 [Ladona fulva]